MYNFGSERAVRFFLALLACSNTIDHETRMNEAMRKYLRAANHEALGLCDWCQRSLGEDSYRHPKCYELSRVDLGFRL